MEAQCRLCNDKHWYNVYVQPIPPMHDFFGGTPYDDACLLCNPNGAIGFNLGDEWLYWVARAIGGREGQYTSLSGENGTILVTRQVYDPWKDDDSWIIQDCPVCHGWGIWSNNGQIMDCIACGGQPIEYRRGFEPLHAWWVNWQLGHRTMYTMRGSPSLEALVESRKNHSHITHCLISTLEEMPGMVRVL